MPVRLAGLCQRCIGLDAGNHLVIDLARAGEAFAAVYHAVPHRAERLVQVGVHQRQQGVQRGEVIGTGQLPFQTVRGGQAGLGCIQALGDRLEDGAGVLAAQGHFDGGAAPVNDQYEAVCHGTSEFLSAESGVMDRIEAGGFDHLPVPLLSGQAVRFWAIARTLWAWEAQINQRFPCYPKTTGKRLCRLLPTRPCPSTTP